MNKKPMKVSVKEEVVYSSFGKKKYATFKENMTASSEFVYVVARVGKDGKFTRFAEVLTPFDALEEIRRDASGGKR